MAQDRFVKGMLLMALLWVLSGSLSVLVIYTVEHDMSTQPYLWMWLLTISLLMLSFFLLAALIFYFTNATPSVKLGMWLFGMGLFAVLVFAASLSLAYLIVAPESIRPHLWGSIIIATVLWCWISLSGYQQRIKDRRFIEHEFSFEEEHIVVRQPIKTSLDPEPVSNKTTFGRLYHRFGPYLVMGIPLAYPIQSLLSDAGGTPAVLLLLSILGLPLALYVVGRMTCGAYLWVYKVWQLERLHGKPVVFATPD